MTKESAQATPIMQSDVQRFKFMLKTNQIPKDLTKNLDYDRLKEEEEDFLLTDRNRTLQIEKKTLQPMFRGNSVVNRTITGD